MPINSNDLRVFHAQNQTDTNINGGRLRFIKEVIDGVKNNVFPDVTEAERQAGLERLRKVFYCSMPQDSSTLLNSKIHWTTISGTQDHYIFAPGTQTDNQGDITSSPPSRWYGAGSLHSGVSAGDSVLVVDIEADMDIVQDGDSIWIGDGTHEEYHDNVSVSRSGTQVTITLASGDMLANAYAAGDTHVASVYEAGDVEASTDDYQVNSTNGTADTTNYPPLAYAEGSLEHTITLTFTSATDFTANSDLLGDLGSGNINNDFEPLNPDNGKKLFTVQAAMWGGTWATGDTFTFKTHPSAVPVWIKQVVPAGSASGISEIQWEFGGEAA